MSSTAARSASPDGLRVLVVDDEPPALAELSWLLERESDVASVRTAATADEALRELEGVDAVFLDIHLPGLDGLELAQVLARFRTAPAIVFVTAYEEHAVQAFELDAVDYLLKPVRPERLAAAVGRVVAAVAQQDEGGPEAVAGPGPGAAPALESVPVEQDGMTRFVPVAEIRYVEAHGDYARLHTSAGDPLVRVSLATLERRWRRAGFVRVHRSILVAAAHIDGVRFEGGRAVVSVGGTELQASRRYTRDLRDHLLRRGATGGDGRER